jgi:antitoxin ParD1/3/4
MRWTGASERTARYWFSGERGQGCDQLMALTRHSDAVLYVLLALAGRHIVDEPDDQRCGQGVPTACFVCFIGYIEYMRNARRNAMSRTTTMTVRIGGALSDFVSANVGDEGSYENVSEYIRDLIRRDKERAEAEAFKRLKAELTRAFAAPEEMYKPLTAAELIARNQS